MLPTASTTVGPTPTSTFDKLLKTQTYVQILCVDDIPPGVEQPCNVRLKNITGFVRGISRNQSAFPG